jgi:hypothetical protein
MKYFVLALAAMVTFVTSNPSSAQEFSNERVLGLSHTLGLGGVKSELDLSKEQLERLIGYGVSVDGKLQDAFTNFQREYNPRFSEEQIEQLRLKLAEDIQAIRDKEQERIDSVLLPDQIKRLKEIRTQYFRRLHNKGVEMMSEELNLSEDQLSEIKEVRTNLGKRLREHAVGFGRGPRKPLGKISEDEIPETAEPPAPVLTRSELLELAEEEKAKARQEVFDILSASQQAKLREMEGPEYAFQTTYSKPEADKQAEK